MNYLGNAFSLQMLWQTNSISVDIVYIEKEDVPKDVVSVIGHEDTARVVENLLGFSVPFNRQSIILTEKDILYVAQIKGGRLPEGATTLPDNFEISFFKITNVCVSRKDRLIKKLVSVLSTFCIAHDINIYPYLSDIVGMTDDEIDRYR